MSSSHRPFLVVLSSPSGAGKTSICRGVVRRDPGVAYSVSATTRPRRHNEVDGRDYFFLTGRDFRRRLSRSGFLEHAEVYDAVYGTPRAAVLGHFREGRDVIADLDIQGMRSCRRALPDCVTVFVTAPDRGELKRRLHGRGTDSARVIARRQAELEAELRSIPEFDYLVVNDRLRDAVDTVLAIIRAERRRTSRRLMRGRPGSRPGTRAAAAARRRNSR